MENLQKPNDPHSRRCRARSATWYNASFFRNGATLVDYSSHLQVISAYIRKAHVDNSRVFHIVISGSCASCSGSEASPCGNFGHQNTRGAFKRACICNRARCLTIQSPSAHTPVQEAMSIALTLEAVSIPNIPDKGEPKPVQVENTFFRDSYGGELNTNADNDD